MKRGLAALAALAGLAIVPLGCAAPASPGASGSSDTSATPAAGDIELTGTLRIKGNEPFTVVVLEVDGARRWEVDGVPVASLRQYAGKQVTVRGRVVRTTAEGVVPPAIAIDSPAAVRPR